MQILPVMTMAVQHLLSELPRYVTETEHDRVKAQWSEFLDRPTLDGGKELLDGVQRSFPALTKKLSDEMNHIQEIQDAIGSHVSGEIEEIAAKLHISISKVEKEEWINASHLAIRSKHDRPLRVNSSVDDPERGVVVHRVDGRTEIVRLENIRLNFRRLPKFVAASILTINEATNLYLLACVVLLVWRDYRGLLTVPVGAAEASVLWGILHARTAENVLNDDRILTVTNQERVRLENNVLAPEEVALALLHLCDLGVIARDPENSDGWVLTEDVAVI